MEPTARSRATSWVDVTVPRRRTGPSSMAGKLREAMKIHRAVVLVVMMLVALGALVLLTAAGVANFDGHSLIALLVVIVAAAIRRGAVRWERFSQAHRMGGPLSPRLQGP